MVSNVIWNNKSDEHTFLFSCSNLEIKIKISCMLSYSTVRIWFSLISLLSKNLESQDLFNNKNSRLSFVNLTNEIRSQFIMSTYIFNQNIVLNVRTATQRKLFSNGNLRLWTVRSLASFNELALAWRTDLTFDWRKETLVSKYTKHFEKFLMVVADS